MISAQSKKIIFFVSVAMVVLWAIFEQQAPLTEAESKVQINEAEKKVSPPAVSIAPELIAGKTLQTKRPKIVTAKPSKPNSEPHKAFAQKQKWLLAEIRDGMAVAQSDILLGKVDDQDGKLDLSKITYARVEPNPSKLWPSSVIPIVIHPQLRDTHRVYDAIDSFHAKTNIRFVLLDEMISEGGNPKGHLLFMPNDELCASYLGFQGGEQPIFVSDECSAQGVRHEIMHALGFPHEQSREQRDNFVTIKWENIEPDRYDQFAIIPDTLIHQFGGRGFDFNFKSIMLYPPNAFSKDGASTTMESKTGKKIEPITEGLSPIDIERVNFLYE